MLGQALELVVIVRRRNNVGEWKCNMRCHSSICIVEEAISNSDFFAGNVEVLETKLDICALN